MLELNGLMKGSRDVDSKTQRKWGMGGGGKVFVKMRILTEKNMFCVINNNHKMVWFSCSPVWEHTNQPHSSPEHLYWDSHGLLWVLFCLLVGCFFSYNLTFWLISVLLVWNLAEMQYSTSQAMSHSFLCKKRKETFLQKYLSILFLFIRERKLSQTEELFKWNFIDINAD